MSLAPERDQSAQRRDSQVWWLFICGGVAFVAAVMLALLLLFHVDNTQATTNRLVLEVKQAQSNHASTLNSISALTKEINTVTQQISQAQGLANSVRNELETKVALLNAEMVTICQSISGCHLPPGLGP